MAVCMQNTEDAKRRDLAQQIPLKALEKLAGQIKEINKDKDQILADLQRTMNASEKFQRQVEVVAEWSPRMHGALIESRLVWLEGPYYCVNIGSDLKRADGPYGVANIILDSLSDAAFLASVDMISWHKEADGLSGVVYFGASKPEPEPEEEAPPNSDSNTDTATPTVRQRTFDFLLHQMTGVMIEIFEAKTRDGVVDQAKIADLEKEADHLRNALRIIQSA